jgi:hypothetical protein
MINARRHTLFGAGHNISRPGQADFERGAAATNQEAAQAQAAKLRGARVVRHSLVNARPGRTPQGYAGVAGQVSVQRGRLHCYLERPARVGWHC